MIQAFSIIALALSIFLSSPTATNAIESDKNKQHVGIVINDDAAVMQDIHDYSINRSEKDTLQGNFISRPYVGLVLGVSGKMRSKSKYNLVYLDTNNQSIHSGRNKFSNSVIYGGFIGYHFSPHLNFRFDVTRFNSFNDNAIIPEQDASYIHFEGYRDP